MIDFGLTAQQEELKARTEEFIRDKIIPLEQQGEPQRIQDEERREMNRLAAEAGLLAPHVATEWGGLGLDHVTMSERQR